jgi:rhodanese-related sulfurtransferase
MGGIISGERAMVENISPVQVWEALQSDPDARLVDVRTDAEWNYVGLPDLSAAGQEPVLIPWQVYPGMQVNAAFTEHMRRAGLNGRHHVYFLCRSGVRSLAGGRDGFEGGLDGDGHRGVAAGWKAAGLPWRQR